MGYSDPTASRDLLGNRSLCFIFICAFGLVTLLQQILYGKNYIKSGQQFSRLKGEEVGNWSGLISYLDDGGMKPARNGRKRYKPAQKPLNNTTNTLERQRERMPHRRLHVWTGDTSNPISQSDEQKYPAVANQIYQSQSDEQKHPAVANQIYQSQSED